MKIIDREYSCQWIGTSEEDKPVTGVADGSTFYEVDTGKTFILYSSTWYDTVVEPETDGE